ncbi:MAG: 50S ribosomal protein L30 [Candidatus Thioglobus sp.]|nr:MAG: 50S ribosomal protein L30 [Candidatus Thioglobus sp.]RUM77899.1 MAG: 50S ribosomal protein L30 [Candidatus Thioglobus sp.]RUM81619.1 MAG: 50S ribosomal protein L30 [Candidatus Thioglobus sp.]RUM83776.1 MAG: 50S ribosomal protein L30 [Candidatus Thioglobus sp.]
MAEEKKVVKKAAPKKVAAKKPAAKKAPAKAAATKVVAKKPAAKNAAPKKNTVSVTLVKSFHGRLPTHRATITGLGLKRINHTVVLQDTPEVRGMINKVSYLLKVEG